MGCGEVTHVDGYACAAADEAITAVTATATSRRHRIFVIMSLGSSCAQAALLIGPLALRSERSTPKRPSREPHRGVRQAHDKALLLRFCRADATLVPGQRPRAVAR